MKALGENQISLDCDVIQADGGTRTASITGAWVACMIALRDARTRLVSGAVLTDNVAAISCGIYDGVPVADLDYAEDSTADTDANFVFTGAGDIVEIQATAEGVAFDEAAFMELMRLARQSIETLVTMQKAAVDE